MSESYRTIEVRPLAGALGAEILGIDLAGEIGARQFDELRAAYDEFGVIFFRDQALSPEQHIAFARRWGARQPMKWRSAPWGRRSAASRWK